jgi:hypothetical protein
MALLLAVGLVLVASAAETVVISQDFESGTTDFVNWIRADYDDVPSVVTSDADFVGAAPPPSGTHFLRNADDDNTVFGLAGAHASGEASEANYFHRASVGFVSATIQAEIYMDTSASNSEHNFALCAIEDADAPSAPAPGAEAFYRFGYRNGEVYLHLFDSAGRYGPSGTTVLATPDTAIVSSLNLPGWNLLAMQFDNAGNINCFVNGNPCSFNPANDPKIEWLTAGALAFNFTTQDPLLVDDVLLSYDPATVPVELSTFTAD